MNIIVDSTFNPFSYRDLMQPVYDYKQAYEETEAQFADLVTQTEAWKDIANRENSPEAYAMYKSYADQLNAIVDDFSQGMNSRNRRQLLGMKRRYASEITPIAKASEAMNAANALRDQASPDAIFEVGRYNSLDQFLHGQTANNKYESRKDITARTAALTQAVAQSIIEDPIIRQSMSPQFLEVIQKRGLGSLKELQAAIAGNPAAANRFAQIRNQMIDQVGGLDRFDAQGRAAVEGAINEGLYAGLNNYQTSLQRDGEYVDKANRMQLALQQSKFDYEKQKDKKKEAIASGEIAFAVDPVTGERFHSNGVQTWSETPIYETLPDIPGSNYKGAYKYYNDKGERVGWSTDANKTTLNGQKVHKKIIGYTTSNPVLIDQSEPDKLGHIYATVNLHTSPGRKYLINDGGKRDLVQDEDALIGASSLTTSDLTFAEEWYLENFLKYRPSIKKENLAFYRKYIDEEGNTVSRDSKGAKPVFLIADKKNEYSKNKKRK